MVERVFPVSPTTFSAYLQVIVFGLRGLQVEKHAQEVMASITQLQKDFGRWTSYGGGGYWNNPGPGNRNYWFAGWLLQYQCADNLALGGELFHPIADRTELVRVGMLKRDASGQTVLQETYHRHWPRGTYVTTASRDSMRR